MGREDFCWSAAVFGFYPRKVSWLTNRLVDDDGALDEALGLARQIAANCPLAIAATKQIIVDSPDWAAEEAFTGQAKIFEGRSRRRRGR